MSYVTTTEADTYVSGHFLSTEQAYVQWTALDTASKQIMLNRAFEKIERLPYVGCKAVFDQVAQFPRRGQLDVPQNIKDAQVLEAVSELMPESVSQRSLRARNVKSYSIGHLSETFGVNGSGIFGDPMNAVSSEALTLLMAYLSGGHRIC